MRPLYILDRHDGSVRRERATPFEIREVATGKRNDRLVMVTLGDSGDLVVHELTADELKSIAADLDADVERRLYTVLDGTLALAKPLIREQV